MFERLDEIRKSKRISVKNFEDAGIPRSKYYRILEKGDASLHDMLSLMRRVNLTINEFTLALEKSAFTDLSEDTPYTNYNIVSLLLFLSNAPFLSSQPDFSEKLAILQKNKQIQLFYPDVSLLLAIIDPTTPNKDQLVEELYHSLMARDVWTSYEITLVFSISSNTDSISTDTIYQLLNALDDLYQVQNDDHLAIKLITILRSIFFEHCLKCRDIQKITFAHTSVQHARHNEDTIYVSFYQKYVDILYDYLQGKFADADVKRRRFTEASEFILDNHYPQLPYTSAFNYELVRFMRLIDDWRRDLGVADDYNLLLEREVL
jgi:DNA-binding PadR family transcriptional regulator